MLATAPKWVNDIFDSFNSDVNYVNISTTGITGNRYDWFYIRINGKWVDVDAEIVKAFFDQSKFHKVEVDMATISVDDLF